MSRDRPWLPVLLGAVLFIHQGIILGNLLQLADVVQAPDHASWHAPWARYAAWARLCVVRTSRPGFRVRGQQVSEAQRLSRLSRGDAALLQ